MLYVIFADGTWDQVVETEAQLKKEKKDLKAMGHKVSHKSYESWDEVNKAEEVYNARR